MSVLVPDPIRRKSHFTAFKWVVAFATWRYNFKSVSEQTMYEQHKRYISKFLKINLCIY